MNNLKFIRKANGVSIQELSDGTGINRVTLSRYENNTNQLKNMRAETILKIADFFEIEDIRIFFRRLS